MGVELTFRHRLIVRNLQWRLGYYIWIKTGNCGKSSTKIGMSHRPLKNNNLPDGKQFFN